MTLLVAPAPYRLSANTITADTVVPSTAARSFAACHTSSGTFTVRNGVGATSERRDARALTRSGTRDGVRVVGHVDEAVTPLLRLGDRSERGGDEGLAAVACSAGASDLHAPTVLHVGIYVSRVRSGRMKWLCTDCAWKPKHGRRHACPLCCGYNTPEACAVKRTCRQAELRRQAAA
ncbi:MAG: hypothetical protein JWM02_3658 [Frankiales bacterium]|nr:hypothetical protein [Frankiales bacterium]